MPVMARAGGNIGKAHVVQAAPDGLTVLLDGTGSMAIAAAADAIACA